MILMRLLSLPFAMPFGLNAPIWKVGLVALILAASVFFWLWIGALRAENGELRADRRRLMGDAAVARAALVDAEAALAALARDGAAARVRANKARARRDEALAAPKDDDAPLAPVLRRALERLR